MKRVLRMRYIVSIIIENNKNEVLLQLRDNNAKYYKHCWVFLGGKKEKKESEIEGIIREIKEEIGIKITNPRLVKCYKIRETELYLFYIKRNININKIKLTEGEKIKFFKPQNVLTIKTGYNIKQIIKDFIKFKNDKKC